MLILATVSLPLRSRAISSSAGAIILQGPHHSAQKSTSTGPDAFRTSVSKELSLTWVVLIGIPLLIAVSNLLMNLWTPPARVKPSGRRRHLRAVHIQKRVRDIHEARHG